MPPPPRDRGGAGGGDDGEGEGEGLAAGWWGVQVGFPYAWGVVRGCMHVCLCVWRGGVRGREGERKGERESIYMDTYIHKCMCVGR